MAVEYVPGIPIMSPLVDIDNQPFWDGIKKHELAFQKCTQCNNFIHPPKPMCPHCQTVDTFEWAPSCGVGHIYSYVIVGYASVAYPGMKVPYEVVIVEMDHESGVRVISNMADGNPEDLHIGMPVEVVFDDISEDLTLFKFKKRSA